MITMASAGSKTKKSCLKKTTVIMQTTFSFLFWRCLPLYCYLYSAIFRWPALFWRSRSFRWIGDF